MKIKEIKFFLSNNQNKDDKENKIIYNNTMLKRGKTYFIIIHKYLNR